MARVGIGARLGRMAWLMFVVAPGLLAACWWVLSPGGFGPGQPRFWLNRVAAPAVAVATVATLWALRQGRGRRLLLAWPTAWAGVAVGLRLAFPIAMAWRWLVPMAIALAMGWAAIRARRPVAFDLVAMTATALAGLLVAMALRPPSPGTRPIGGPIAADGPGTDRIASGVVRLADGSMLQATDGSLMARFRPLSIEIRPLLRFLSRSPDGAPVLLVPDDLRDGPQPRFRDGWRLGPDSWRLDYDFPGQGPATLRAGVGTGGAIVLEANSRLDRAVYSHLNGFCDIEVRGHRRLSIEFSPCPGTPIEVRLFRYLASDPARFAYVAADRTFRVVEASFGEKGPYRTLARGRLDPDEPMGLTLLDDSRPVARVVLEDFAAQAHTTPSPTAGWGVPANAIEFSLAEQAPSSLASIFVTLSGTSVGIGWDCVGHRPGNYRNRVRLETAGHAEGDRKNSTRDHHADR